MKILIEVKKPFGFYADHYVGEKFTIPLSELEELIVKGYVSIVVNNMGNNLEYDESENELPEAIPVFPTAEPFNPDNE
jgi:hypothetical protein